MRLLLDEHLSPRMAASLRQVGHDVVAVAERRELRNRTDVQVLEVASTERRVVASENVRDYARLGVRRLPSKKRHHGVVLMSPVTFPRSRAGFGLVIRALEALLRSHPGADDLVGEVVWLQPASNDRH